MEHFDYSLLRESDKESWLELIDNSLTFPEICRNLLPLFVGLKSEELERIALAYILSPSALCNKLPIMACIGATGTGKSTLGKLAACLYYGNKWGNNIKSASLTFASLRTALYKNRFPHGEEAEKEVNSILVWDDLAPNFLNDDQIYSLLKSGYDRSTDIINLMGGKNDEGEYQIISHRTFCPKIISTIHPLNSFPEFTELERRLLVIPFYTVSDREFEEFEEFDWSGTRELFDNFWANNALSFVENKKKYRRTLSRKKDGEIIKKHRQSTLRDVFVTGITCRLWTPEEGWELLLEHEKLIDRMATTNQSLLLSLLFNFVDKIGDDPIDPKVLKDIQSVWAKEGLLTTRESSVDALKEGMYFLGYEYELNKGWRKRE